MKKYLTTFAMALAFIFSTNVAAEDYLQIECQIAPLPSRNSAKPHKSIEHGTSTNWSGYAAITSLSHPQVGSVSSVTGTWTVPTITASVNNTYSSSWVGIDGYASDTVEQIGTESDWSVGHGQVNYAWFELFPGASFLITGFPVHAGDLITGQVTYQGSSTYELILTNHTEHIYTIIPASKSKIKNAQRSSAEWIVEAPSISSGILPLANFGTIAFSNCTATINGVTGAINNSHWHNDAITMVTINGAIRSLPSSLTNGGENFTMTWEHQ
jgi:Peptidase A4 family